MIPWLRPFLVVPLLVLAVLCVPIPVAAQGDPGEPLARLPTPVDRAGDPIAVAAYGLLLDADLKPIEPTPEFLRTTLDLYIEQLTREADQGTREALNGIARCWRKRSRATR